MKFVMLYKLICAPHSNPAHTRPRLSAAVTRMLYPRAFVMPFTIPPSSSFERSGNEYDLSNSIIFSRNRLFPHLSFVVLFCLTKSHYSKLLKGSEYRIYTYSIPTRKSLIYSKYNGGKCTFNVIWTTCDDIFKNYILTAICFL